MDIKECFLYLADKLKTNIFTREYKNSYYQYMILTTCHHTPEEFEILKNANLLDKNYVPQTKINFCKIEYAPNSPGKERLTFSFRERTAFTRNITGLQYPSATLEDFKSSYWSTGRSIVFYPNNNIWCFQNKKKKTGYPCSLKDFFYYQEKSNIEYKPYLLLFQFLGKTYPIFKDLATDFENGSAYTSIPMSEVFSCNTRRELLGKYYGTDGLKRNNKECIGDGIFLHRASRLVNKNEIQKLYGFHCYPCFIGRKREDMEKPLTYFLHEYLKGQFPEMEIMVKNRRFGYNENELEKISFQITKTFIQDAVSLSISMNLKIPLTWHSLRAVKEWHDELAIRFRNKQLPTVKIPKDSIFKRLKMPQDCIRLTSRKQFLEESQVNNNCVAGYINRVNRDLCSIWSMRKPDGQRYTIEIRRRKAKNYQGGYFCISQMLGFDNCDVPEIDYNRVRECLEKQNIPKHT